MEIALASTLLIGVVSIVASRRGRPVAGLTLVAVLLVFGVLIVCAIIVIVVVISSVIGLFIVAQMLLAVGAGQVLLVVVFSIIVVRLLSRVVVLISVGFFGSESRFGVSGVLFVLCYIIELVLLVAGWLLASQVCLA